MAGHYIDWSEEFYKTNDAIMKSIKEALPDLNKKRVLDAGTGYGRMMNVMESLGVAEVYGVDASNDMVNEAKKRVSNPSKVFLSDIEGKMIFEDGFFDIIVGRYVLHYLKAPDAVYHEFNRILKAKGCLIFVVTHPVMDLMLQKDQVYGKQEVVTLDTEHKSGLKLKYPSHRIEDYLSDTFLEFFFLDYFKEISEPDDEYIHSMLIKAVKRSG